MGYFEDVYLKRVNVDGTTQQERVKTRKEIEFDKLFLKKTEYQSRIVAIDKKPVDLIGSLQPNKWNESQLISNLLLSTSTRPLATGNILDIKQKIKNKEYNKKWLVIFCPENITKGYYSYKVICLDSEINITNEYGDTLHTVPVKFVNAAASLVVDYFNFTNSVKGYREPERKIRFITKDFDFLKKDVYFSYKDRGWILSGKDNISIDNVAYVSIVESLVEEVEPKTSAEIEVGADRNFFLINR